MFVFFIDRVVGTVLTVQDEGIVVGVLMVVREDIVDPGFFLVGREGGMDQVVLVRQGEGIDEESGGRRVTEDVLDIVETDLVVTGEGIFGGGDVGGGGGDGDQFLGPEEGTIHTLEHGLGGRVLLVACRSTGRIHVRSRCSLLIAGVAAPPLAGSVSRSLLGETNKHSNPSGETNKHSSRGGQRDK